MKNIFALIILCLSTPAAYAYIPPYWMIISRTADNHGKGTYAIEQEVQFQLGEETGVVSERWFVQNEQSFRVEVIGKNSLKDRVRLTYIYHNGRKTFIDENGVKKSEKIPTDFFEPFFHFRNAKTIKQTLVSLDIAPASSLKSELHKYSEKNPTPEPENYIRLSRWGGVINYAVGSPTPVSSSDNSPGLWIEQDQFLVRKIRFSTQTEIDAHDYSSFSGGLWLPKLRQVRWGQFSAKILTQNVKTAQATKDLFEPSSLNFGKNPELSRALPAEEIIKDFYTRLR